MRRPLAAEHNPHIFDYICDMNSKTILKNRFLRRIVTAALLSAMAIVITACQGDPVREAIARQLAMYPESRVQDIYKSFCQDNLGPGHLIPNPDHARAYLMSELEEYRKDLETGQYDKPQLRYEPVGDQGNYVRVDLSAVLDGMVDADTLLDAFVRSANEGKVLTEEAWKQKWRSIADVIRQHFPDIPEATDDLAAIDSLIDAGHLILHHSEVFGKAYHPHYRIVDRQIFENELKERICTTSEKSSP